ncbi:MAG: hypothetical protein IPO07_24750 [Haliscomenobacter sp.]|nr:hypothetical protein [Haliscomenobacter sp.]MBK9491649.1 hypothetical protein [Haliscomenobacter sp.]
MRQAILFFFSIIIHFQRGIYPATTFSVGGFFFRQYQAMKVASVYKFDWIPLGPTLNSARADGAGWMPPVQHHVRRIWLGWFVENDQSWGKVGTPF